MKSVGSVLDRSTRGVWMLDEARNLHATDGDYVEFTRAGAHAAGAFHCSNCGYGVTVQTALPICPMCAGTTWEPASTSSLPRRRPLQ